MSLKNHREALSVGAIHHWLQTEYRGRVKEHQRGALADVIVQRIKLDECNIRLTFVNGKPVVLSDRAAEQAPKGLMQ
jgi:hypothetical protein